MQTENTFLEQFTDDSNVHFCINYFSLQHLPLEIQLKVQLSHQSAKIYTLERRIEKLEARNRTLTEKVKYFEKKEKQRSADESSHSEAENKHVYNIYLFIKTSYQQ